ncbi:MAG: dihydrofolate reductase [Minisyncoccia bacterium]
MPVVFEIVVAVSRENVIGYKGQLPWGRLPRDLSHFKDITTEHSNSSVVIGYNTLDSLCKMTLRRTNILPGRKIYVLTNDLQKMARFPDCIGVSDIDSVIRLGNRSHVFIAGGESIYHQFVKLPQTRVIHMTRIIANYHGDTFFPLLSSNEWCSKKVVFCSSDEKNKHAMQFVTLTRV